MTNETAKETITALADQICRIAMDMRTTAEATKGVHFSVIQKAETIGHLAELIKGSGVRK